MRFEVLCALGGRRSSGHFPALPLRMETGGFLCICRATCIEKASSLYMFGTKG